MSKTLEIFHLIQSMQYQNPKPELVPSFFISLLPFPPSHVLHQLQTSIIQSFIKLETFLRPFLITRSHDKSAHIFRYSH